MIKISFLLVE